MRLAFTYAILALIATAANVATQDLMVRIYTGPVFLILSIGAGTAVGLVAKYLLDKRYIFRFRARSAAHDGRVFVLYACMGLVTTAFFWSVEYIFHVLYGSTEMRYLGACIGLAIGYLAKYYLDKRYVFRAEAA